MSILSKLNIAYP